MGAITVAMLVLVLSAKNIAFDVLVNEIPTNRTQFCSGERLTFICRSNHTFHYVWQIPPLVQGTVLLVSYGIPKSSSSIFNATFVSTNESRLHFVASTIFNNKYLICRDGVTNEILSTDVLLVYDYDVYLSDLIYMMGVVSWSVPNHFMDCIAGYEYSFQYSGVSGVLPANVNTLSLDMFNISTLCDVDFFSINPIHHTFQPQETMRYRNIIKCISTENELRTTTMEKFHETTQEGIIECGDQRQTCFGALLGVSMTAIVIILFLVIINILQAIKIKILQSKTVIACTREDKHEEVKYDEIKLESNPHNQEVKKNTANILEEDTGIAMVSCEAYGRVSKPQSGQNQEQHDEGANAVYEALK